MSFLGFNSSNLQLSSEIYFMNVDGHPPNEEVILKFRFNVKGLVVDDRENCIQ